MALDIIGHINAGVTSLTAEQKQTMLSDFCERHRYDETLHGTKKVFANSIVVQFIKESVEHIRNKAAKEAISIEELVLS